MTRLADILLRLAVRIAPPARRQWVEALRAESEVIEDGSAALRWAAGGFVAALGWSARRELPYLVALPAALYGQIWIAGYGMELAMALGAPFMEAAKGAQVLTVFLLSVIFAAWRPRRAVLVGLLTPILGWLWLLDVFLTRAERLPVPWTFYLECMVDFGWPAAVGATVGAIIGRRLKMA
ncbi:MAG: hypothetical protein JWR84_1555 [Caulobacter sp.]|nr:hypothetical protein [Caulobacter sp.]